MVKEEYVTFETAKLLKEKGFSEKCTACYHEEITPRFELISGRVNYCNPRFQKFKMKPPVNAPTQQAAMRWLREVHNIIPLVLTGGYSYEPKLYYWFRIDTFKNEKWEDAVYREDGIDYSTYEEACEAAILYCLKNLVMIEDDYRKPLEEEERDYERFNKLIHVPLMDLSDEDLDWAYRQDKFNSINSKGFFYQEIIRRKEQS